MEWIKFDEKMPVSEFLDYFVGQYFLGRYEEFFPNYPTLEKTVTAIRYYYSHVTAKGRLHIQSYPPPMPCPEINTEFLKLTHYMILEQPND